MWWFIDFIAFLINLGVKINAFLWAFYFRSEIFTPSVFLIKKALSHTRKGFFYQNTEGVNPVLFKPL
jgi:hypothetical protein